jgi:CO dehydrogenase/acetyl-CoA synthase beta subunit
MITIKNKATDYFITRYQLWLRIKKNKKTRLLKLKEVYSVAILFRN